MTEKERSLRSVVYAAADCFRYNWVRKSYISPAFWWVVIGQLFSSGCQQKWSCISASMANNPQGGLSVGCVVVVCVCFREGLSYKPNRLPPYCTPLSFPLFIPSFFLFLFTFQHSFFFYSPTLLVPKLLPCFPLLLFHSFLHAVLSLALAQTVLLSLVFSWSFLPSFSSLALLLLPSRASHAGFKLGVFIYLSFSCQLYFCIDTKSAFTHTHIEL